MKNKFQIGDKVKITNKGYTYYDFKEMKEHFNFSKKIIDKSYIPTNGLIGYIKNHDKHIHHSKNIVYHFITTDNKHYLIGEEGLKLEKRLDLNEKLESAIKMSVKRKWQDDHHYGIIYQNSKEVRLVFERFRINNYESELKNSTRTKLDKYVLEIIRNDLPELWGTKIQFYDHDILTKENYVVYTI